MLPEHPVNVLIVGAGGREHAIAWKLASSPHVKQVFCAPGNGGTSATAKVSNVAIKVSQFDAIADFCRQEQVELVVIGPDNPLADGIVDALTATVKGLRVFGPTRQAARIEWSKSFAKEFMLRHKIPTARYIATNDPRQALEFARANDWARVVKVDGLALGKGVFVCDCLSEVEAALAEIFEKKSFGEAGASVLIEERLVGAEMSLLYFCDGKRLVAMPASQDHKRRFDGDLGPNTGGMGVYAPVALYGRCAQAIETAVKKPFEAALSSGSFSYKGIVYAGLIVTENDQPFVLEFNARFGDPETQALLPLLLSDLFEILWACCEGSLEESAVVWSDQFSCCVVAAAKSYPAASSKGEPISIGTLPERCYLFQAGTSAGHQGITTDGGRVLSVTATARDMESARDLAYKAIKQVSFAGMDYRTDIARGAAKQCLSS